MRDLKAAALLGLIISITAFSMQSIHYHREAAQVEALAKLLCTDRGDYESVQRACMLQSMAISKGVKF